MTEEKEEKEEKQMREEKEEKEEKEGLNNQTVQTKVIRNNGNIYLINIEYLIAEVPKFAAILQDK